MRTDFPEKVPFVTTGKKSVFDKFKGDCTLTEYNTCKLTETVLLGDLHGKNPIEINDF